MATLSNGPRRLAIAASCVLFRDAVALVAQRAGDFKLVGAFDSSAEAGRTMAALAPELVVVGQNLRDGFGVELVRRLRTRLPPTQWLLVLNEAHVEDVREAQALGIGGIVLKRSGLGHLQRAIQALRRNRRFRCPGVSAILAAPGPAEAVRPTGGMTRREREVLHWVAEGKRNHEIATILGTRPGTVCKQMESILRKLGVETRGAAVATWRATCSTRGCTLCR